MTTKIRASLPNDNPVLLDLWHNCVKATHHFLIDSDIVSLYQGLKNEWLDAVNIWILEDDDSIVGFIGLHENRVEMLFIDVAAQGKGYGTVLVNFAKQQLSQKSPQILLDVNEQNPAAVEFYLKQGFNIIGRSDTDSQGNPFPLLHLSYTSQSPTD